MTLPPAARSARAQQREKFAEHERRPAAAAKGGIAAVAPHRQPAPLLLPPVAEDPAAPAPPAAEAAVTAQPTSLPSLPPDPQVSLREVSNAPPVAAVALDRLPTNLRTRPASLVATAAAP